MVIFRCRSLILLFLFFVLSNILCAQSVWHEETMLGLDNVHLTTLKGISIPAEAEYKGHKFNANVFFYGYDGHAGGKGYPSLGIHVDGIEKYIPESQLEKFMGPDLSQYAVQNNVIQLNLRQGASHREISTRLLFTDGKFFDPGFQTIGYFETNPKRDKASTIAWKQFLLKVSEGFEEGKVVIGKNAFPGELIVKFSGNGLGFKLQNLIAYCNKTPVSAGSIKGMSSKNTSSDQAGGGVDTVLGLNPNNDEGAPGHSLLGIGYVGIIRRKRL
jgi:hypothetical protein